MKIKVAVFDDNSSRRTSLGILINQQCNMECVGFFEDCSSVLTDIKSTQPDVVLMDINMPRVDGIQGVRILRKEYPNLFIIMQTVFEDDDKIISAIIAGANGYILKKTHPSTIIESIHDVMNGGAPMTSSVARRVLELFQKTGSIEVSKTYNLSTRETEVLSLLIKGFSYKMIAASQQLSVFTVNAHMRNIYKKLQVHSVAEAVSKAIHHKLV